jgi:hypothetical protein
MGPNMESLWPSTQRWVHQKKRNTCERKRRALDGSDLRDKGNDGALVWEPIVIARQDLCVCVFVRVCVYAACV